MVNLTKYLTLAKLTRYFQPNYWLAPSQNSNSWITIALLVGVCTSFILAVYFSSSRSRHPAVKQLHGKISTWLWTCFFTEGLVVFGRWQQLPLLSLRLVAGLITLLVLVWGLIVFIWRIFGYPVEVKYYKRQRTYEKYLPRGKNN